MAQNTCASINTFINLPFGFKLFYGMVSDCVPIFGQHRKPYLVGGWGLCFAAALLGALSDELDLPTSSSLFLAMTVAYLVADCAADAALVGYSALEPKESTEPDPKPNPNPKPKPKPKPNPNQAGGGTPSRCVPRT